MTSVWANVAIVAALIAVEGLFVGAEIALVSLREGQVRAMAESGRRGRRVAKLVADPNRFLASVQLGVTLTALLSSAFGAITLSAQAKSALISAGLARGAAGPLGFLGVTLIITFVTLVIGELAPKRIALQRAERTATLVAPVLDRIAALTRPVIWLLSRSTDVVVRILGGDPRAPREAISEEELRGLVAAHESLSGDERRLIDEVFAAGNKQLREVMVPRTEVQFLDASMSVQRAFRLARELPHSRYPLVRGSTDDVVGFIHVRDLVAAQNDPGRRITEVAREVKLLPASKPLLPALSEMRRERHHLAVVVDEYGGTAGIVTLEDLIEEVIGDIQDEYDVEEGPAARRLLDGDVEVDGLRNLEEFTEQTGLVLPDGPYETVAGVVVAGLGHLPRTGEAIEVTLAGSEDDQPTVVRLTVSELDGRRVARVRVTALSAPAPTPPAVAGTVPPADRASPRGGTDPPALPPGAAGASAQVSALRSGAARGGGRQRPSTAARTASVSRPRPSPGPGRAPGLRPE